MSQRWDSAGKHRLFRSSSGAPAQSVLEQLFAAVDMVVYPQLAHSLHGLNGPCPHYVNILIDFFPVFNQGHIILMYLSAAMQKFSLHSIAPQ